MPLGPLGRRPNRTLPLPDVWSLTLATSNEQARFGAPQVNAMHNARPARLAPVIARRETIATPAASAFATTLGVGAATMLDTGSFVSRPGEQMLH